MSKSSQGAIAPNQAIAVPFQYQSFSVSKISEMLGCARSTIFEEIKRGRLKSFKVGRARRVSGAAYLQYQASQAERAS